MTPSANPGAATRPGRPATPSLMPLVARSIVVPMAAAVSVACVCFGVSGLPAPDPGRVGPADEPEPGERSTPWVVPPAEGGPATLEGIYVGQKGETAAWAVFSSSGAFALDIRRQLDPDEALGWETVFKAYGDDDPPGEFSDVTIGIFEEGAGSLRLRSRQVEVDVDQQRILLDELWSEHWREEKSEERTFRTLDGYDVVEIDGVVFVRQRDLSGVILEGDFNQVGGGAFGLSVGTVRFTADGQFAIQEESSFAVPGPYGLSGGGPNAGQGRYEIHRNELVLHYDDGRVEIRLIGDLGQDDQGRQVIAFGPGLWVEGLFDGE